MGIEKRSEEMYMERAERYLSEYSVFRRMKEMDKYELDYFGKSEEYMDMMGRELSLPGAKSVATSKLFEIRRFVMSLGNCNEKVFLFYHYIHGESVGRCAELMGQAPRSAFRLKKRALIYAGLRLDTYLKKHKESVKGGW